MPDDPNTNPEANSQNTDGEDNNVCRLRQIVIRDCQPATQRKQCADDYRDSEANRACNRDLEPKINRNNGEEDTLRDPDTGELIYAANYTKGMPHDAIGEVDPDAYKALLKAVDSQDPADFEAIPIGPGSQPGPQIELRRYVDPQAGVAFDLEGPDAPSAAVYLPDLTIRRVLVAPRFPEAWLAADVGEVYLMALLRDVPLNRFVGTSSTDPDIQDAVRLMKQFSDYRGPVDPTTGEITPQTLFRGGNVYSVPDTQDQSANQGELVGPHLSQFLIIGSRLDDAFPPQFEGGEAGRSAEGGAEGVTLGREDGQVLYGTLTINQRQFEVVPGLDFITDYDTWLSVQNGVEPAEMSRYTGNRRFLYSPRQLAEYVHRDQTYQEGLIAALLIISMNERAERVPGLPPLFNPGNPYLASQNQTGFGTFGNGHLLALLAEGTTRAIKAAWYQKWFNQRRLRPETLGGRIHNVAAEVVAASRYKINDEISLQAQPGGDILRMIFELNNDQNDQNPDRPNGGTFLLPQQYPEGSPLHPSYPAGHATQIATEATLLKGLFNENFPITGPEDRALVPNDDGTALVEYEGPGGRDIVLTLGGELNKLMANVALARSMAGVHYRLDYTESVLLGEYVALGILQEQARSFNPEHFFELTLLSGTKVRIQSDGRIVEV